MRNAGDMLLWLMTDPLGEEITEGTIGGLLAGASQLGTGQDLGATALSTATAIAGGIGMGMLGRRLGRRIGEAVHPKELKDQTGIVATLARLGGSETTAKGFQQQGAVSKEAIKQAILENTTSKMAYEAAVDPAAFAQRYGIEAKQFEQMLPKIKGGQQVQLALNTMQQMPVDERKAMADALLSQYTAVENAVTKQAAGGIDEVLANIAKLNSKETQDKLLSQLSADPEFQAQAPPGFQDAMRKVSQGIGSAAEGMLGPVEPVTGAHVGQAIGRFIGDEVGILSGLAVGNIAAQQLGFESPKDRQIRELQEQLAQRGAA